MLAQHRDPRCKRSLETIQQSLTGNYRAEHVFALTQALALYDNYQAQIMLCDEQIEQQLQRFEPVTTDAPPPPAGTRRAKQRNKHEPAFDIRTYLYQITGVDLTHIDGVAAPTALAVISEIGTDMRRWKTAKHFTSWLGLCPGTKVSGGKVLARANQTERQPRCDGTAAGRSRAGTQ